MLRISQRTASPRLRKRFLDSDELPSDRSLIVRELRLFFDKCVSPCDELLHLALGCLLVECVTMSNLAHLTRCALSSVYRRTCLRERGANPFLFCGCCSMRLVRQCELGLQLLPVSQSVLELF